MSILYIILNTFCSINSVLANHILQNTMLVLRL